MYKEIELVDDFLKSIDPIINFGVDSSFFREVNTPVGIPDIIMIDKFKSNDIKYFISKFPSKIIINRHAKVLSVLSRKFHSMEYLSKKCNLKISTFKRIVKILQDYSIIECNKNNYCRLKNDFNIPEINIWSFEFKLNDWKRALRQSITYRSFCNFSVVVMPSGKKDILVNNKSYFKKFRIGLCIFNPENNEISFIVKPKKFKNISKNLYIDAIGRIGLKEQESSSYYLKNSSDA